MVNFNVNIISGSVEIREGDLNLVNSESTINVRTELSKKENITNRAYSISADSTTTEYPVAKAVYDFVSSSVAEVPKVEEVWVRGTGEISTMLSGSLADTASGYGAVCLGNYCCAKSDNSLVGGGASRAEGDEGTMGILAWGEHVTGSTSYAHAEGTYTLASGHAAHAEGAYTTASGYAAHAEGSRTAASRNYSHAEGSGSAASGQASHAEGFKSLASGTASHAEGNRATASANYSHAEGYWTKALVNYSHAEGCSTRASGSYSHAEGSESLADGYCAHAEGSWTNATGRNSHAEGDNTRALGTCSHAEGGNTVASGNHSHAEGYNTIASGTYAHAEGINTIASGSYSHAEGNSTTASGHYSHAEGSYTIASNTSEHAQGRYNATASNQIFSVGVGDEIGGRKNAVSIIAGLGTTSSASIYIYGIDSYVGNNPVPGTNDLASVIAKISASAVPTDLSGLFASASYDSNAKKIYFYDNQSTASGEIDATAFIKDGMVDTVTINTGSNQMIITFNTDAGKEDIELSLTDIFNPNNFYTKTDVDTLLTTMSVGDVNVIEAIEVNGTASSISGKTASINFELPAAPNQEAENWVTENSASIVTESLWIEGTGTGSAILGPMSPSGAKATGKYAVINGGYESETEYGVTDYYPIIASGDYSHAEGCTTKASGPYSHAEGYNTRASGSYSHAEGYFTVTLGSYSHAEGYYCRTTGSYSHAEGANTQAVGSYSHAEGSNTKAIGNDSHAEGGWTVASGSNSHAEGGYTRAESIFSHAEGTASIALGRASHAEGDGTVARASGSHTEGTGSVASGPHSHAEGIWTVASGSYSHAEGRNTLASGRYSHAEGGYTNTSNYYEHAQGRYNATASSQIFSVGVGDTNARRKNAISIITGSNPSASVYVLGVGSYDGTNPEPGTNDLASVIEGLGGITEETDPLYLADSASLKNAATWVGSNSASAATAISNSHTHSNKAVLDGITAAKTASWDEKVSNVQADWNATSGLAQILNKPTIPAAVTEETVAGWGFTKNTGTYSKPSGGIPKTDLATGVVPVELDDSDNVLAGVRTTIKAIETSDGIYALGSNNAGGNEDYILATTDQIPTESTIAGWGFTKNTGTLTEESDPFFAAKSASLEASGSLAKNLTAISASLIASGTLAKNVTAITASLVASASIAKTASSSAAAVSALTSSLVASASIAKTASSSAAAISAKTGSWDALVGLPAVTAADNGKILRVVNGAWALVDPVTVYSGQGAPDSTLGQDGDIYLQS